MALCVTLRLRWCCRRAPPRCHRHTTTPTRSPLWCVGCEGVIRIAGIHKIGTAGAQQYLDFLDRFSNCAARLAGLNLALQLEEGLAIRVKSNDGFEIGRHDWFCSSP